MKSNVEMAEVADDEWAKAIGQDWSVDWDNPAEDIYTPADGIPENELPVKSQNGHN
jgi:hypothetical protein